MRRSGAPSMKRTPSDVTTVRKNGGCRLPIVKMPLASPAENAPTVSDGDKIVYKVVWGKISTRKHKVWEGDGQLEVLGRNALLKDEDGKVIGSSSGIKEDEIEEGLQMVVGTKEVEIIELVTAHKEGVADSARKRPAESQIITGGIPSKVKKPKVESGKIPYKSVAQPTVATGDPLVMKKPCTAHQVEHNNRKEPLVDVVVPAGIANHLREHQREGVAFLYECVTGMRLQELGGYGAILADEMGMGKTLQCVALMYTLLKQGPYGQPLAKRILIVTPSSLVSNWDKEITKWLENERIFTFILGPKNKLKTYVQSTHIPILIISYETLAKHVEELKTVRFDLIVCDEGHRLKNSGVKIFTTLDGIECKRRILLTGTPIQNDLQEFHSLINYVNPGILGSYQEFRTKYAMPITQSHQPNVLPQYRELGRERLEELNAITEKFVLRRTQEVISKYLPEKQELVVFCLPSDLQNRLFNAAQRLYEEEGPTSISPLQLITVLKKICNHPSLLSTFRKEDNALLYDEFSKILPPWQRMGPDDSAKLSIVEALLDELSTKSEKIVIVSYYNKTLDMIEDLCGHYNYKHCRLDGSTQSSDRNKIVTTFNNASSDEFVLLLSAKAGGVGLNLVGASRLVLYDNDWNPANDLQALSRIWRDGQLQRVFIYRLITAFTIEERIFQRQISKTSLSGAIVDQRQRLNNVNFCQEELKDLFSYDAQQLDCITHTLLECTCNGCGEVPPDVVDLPESAVDEPSAKSQFQVQLKRSEKPKTKTKYALKMQELMKWEHHRTPVQRSVLEDLALATCTESIVFLFRNRVNK